MPVLVQAMQLSTQATTLRPEIVSMVSEPRGRTSGFDSKAAEAYSQENCLFGTLENAYGHFTMTDPIVFCPLSVPPLVWLRGLTRPTAAQWKGAVSTHQTLLVLAMDCTTEDLVQECLACLCWDQLQAAGLCEPVIVTPASSRRS